MAVQHGNKNEEDGNEGDEVMKIRTALKAGKIATNHNETLQVRTGLQGGKKRGLVVRAGLRAGRRAA
jgi:hypothetical protein